MPRQEYIKDAHGEFLFNSCLPCPKAAEEDDDDDADDDDDHDEEEEAAANRRGGWDGMWPFPYDQRGILTKHGRDSIWLKLEIPRHG